MQLWNFIRNLPDLTCLLVHAIVILPYPPNGDSQGQKIFLAASSDNQTRNHDTECYNFTAFTGFLAKAFFSFKINYFYS